MPKPIRRTKRPRAKARAKAAPPKDGATEARILAAAHAVFLREGTAGARMQEIATEAGVNKALLHYYFRNKQSLAEAVFRQNAGRLFPALFATLAADLDLETKVRQIVSLELDHLSRHPYLPAYMISEIHHNPDRIRQLIATQAGQELETIGSGILARLQKQIDAEVRAGRYRPIAARQFLVSLLALCVFPFAARPALQLFLGLDAAGFAGFIAQRRRELPAFFLAGLRP